jgi:hypothetical protein
MGKIAGDMDIRGGVAVWVLGAHVWALFLPLLLIRAVVAHSDFVYANTDYGWIFFVAAAFMMAASAFEIAQNNIDRWYLTPGCASADGKGFCDLLFYWLLVASQATVIIACFGDTLWVSVPAVLLSVVYPWFYLRGKLDMAPLAVLGLGSIVAMWLRFNDPLVLLQLLMSPLTAVLFAALLRTCAQFLHGFVTLVAASNGLFTALIIYSAADGEPTSWGVVAVAAVAVAALFVAVPQAAKNLSASPRPG